MSGIIPLLIFAVIAFNVVSSINKSSSKSSATKRYQERKRLQKQQRQSSSKSQVWRDAGQSTKEQQSKQSARIQWQQAAAREAKRQLEDRMEDRLTRRKDPADKNRHRTADWGSRAGPGILTGRNVFVVFMLILLAAYIMNLGA